MNATRILRVVAVSLVLACPVLLQAQVYVQQGNVLDANPQINSGGLNSGTRYSGYNLGNRIVSGNVAGGASFRGYSPIRDPSTLFFTNYAQPLAGVGISGISNFALATYTAGSGLPSDRLTPFNRSSVSIANASANYIPGSLSRTPYYSPSSAVANTGALVAKLNRPGTSQLNSAYGPARAPDARLTPSNPLDVPNSGPGSLMSESPRLVRIDTGQAITGPVNPRLANSALFANVREIPLESLADQAKRGEGRAQTATPEDAQAKAAEEARREAANRANQPSTTAQPGQEQPNPQGTPEGASSRLMSNSKTSSLASTGDVYGRMRVASSALAHRLPTIGPEPTGVTAKPGTPESRTPTGGTPQMPPPQPAEESLGPISTFVGTQNTAINAHLAEAEDLLKQGQYYRAAEAYTVAQTVDPTNPLPHLGRSVSLLAAGDYMSSATALFTAMRLFDSLGRFQIDLKSFVPDASVLESRRADLEKRLQLFDDFRLRFLLGYLQYSTGLPDAGLANMEAAAQKSPSEFQAVGQFVSDLKARRLAAPAPATQPAQ